MLRADRCSPPRSGPEYLRSPFSSERRRLLIGSARREIDFGWARGVHGKGSEEQAGATWSSRRSSHSGLSTGKACSKGRARRVKLRFCPLGGCAGRVARHGRRARLHPGRRRHSSPIRLGRRRSSEERADEASRKARPCPGVALNERDGSVQSTTWSRQRRKSIGKVGAAALPRTIGREYPHVVALAPKARRTERLRPKQHWRPPCPGSSPSA